MQCRGYFLRDEDGVLRCTQCGKSADEHPRIENKSAGRHGESTIFPPESTRISRVAKQSRKR